MAIEPSPFALRVAALVGVAFCGACRMSNAPAGPHPATSDDRGGNPLVRRLVVGDASCPRVVLVAGMNRGAPSWSRHGAPLLAELEAAGFPVVGVSLRGRGDNVGVFSDWTPEAHHRDLAAALASEGWADYHLVAHSAGVAYALGFVLEGGARPRTFVAGDYYPALAEFTADWAEGVRARTGPGGLDPDAVVAQQWSVEPTDAAFEVDGHRVRLTRDYRSRLGELSAPVLFVGGPTFDLAAPMWRLAADVEVVNARVGHDVYESGRVAQHVVRFLRRQSAGTPCA